MKNISLNSSLIIPISLFLAFFGLFWPQTSEAACMYGGNYYQEEDCIRLGLKPNPYTTSVVNTGQIQITATEIASLEAQVRQLLAILEQLKARLAYTNQYNYQYQYQYGNSGYTGSSLVTVYTGGVRDIDDDSATLEGEVDFRSSDEATVYFRYGYTPTNLTRETVHVVLDDNDDEEFSQRIIDLRRVTDYYYQAIAEDEDGRIALGSIRSFDTDSRSSDDDDDDDENQPEIDIDDINDITEDSVELEISADMNDFEDGRVFVVYGEDEDQIKDIEDDYDTYDDIDEDGDDLQKHSVDSSLDDDENYTVNITGLDSDSDIFVIACIEYEDEDDDDRLVCSSVEEFTTDN